MRGIRFLFTAALVCSLGAVSIAGFESDRDAVTDLQASQLAGGQACPTWTPVNCSAGNSACTGSCLCCSGRGTGLGTPYHPCGGNSSCGWVADTTTGCVTTTTATVPQ
jgi:hypothetical protein